MEWLRTWIMQIAGIIVLGAVCDMIMPHSEMKKYTKMVTGLVLVFAIVRPVVNFSPDAVDMKIPGETRQKAVELKNRLDEKEQEEVLRIYCGKLEKSIENRIYSDWNCRAKATVNVEEKDETQFGNINSLKLEFEKNTRVNVEEIQSVIGKEFGVSPKNIETYIQ